MSLVVAPSPFDAVTEAARSADAIQYLFVGVDYFGPEQFRLFPLFRREWPQTQLVAYHSNGFEHKGHIARLVGADVLLAMPGGVASFLETLPTNPPVPASADVPPPAAESQAPIAPPLPAPQARESGPTATASRRRPTVSAVPHACVSNTKRPADVPSMDAPLPPRPDPQEPSPAGSDSAAPPAPAPPSHEPVPAPATLTPQGIENLDGDDELERGRVLGTVELTDEELRVLLGEDDDP